MGESANTERAAAALAAAGHVLALTGAGISAESGIPTFREAQTGLWARFDPQDLATPEAFARDPQRIWAWYRWRRTLIARGGVNAGHRALAALERFCRVTVATQNVDGLHAAAGSRDIAELHGNIWRERCGRCGATVTRAVAEQDAAGELPRCDDCGGPARPAVVWFGELLPEAAMRHAQEAVENADCVLVVGTSNRVYPAAALVDAAIASAAVVIEINPEATAVSETCDLRLSGRASVVLPALVERLAARADAG